MPKTVRACAGCGAVFERYPSRRDRYCGRVCAAGGRRRSLSERFWQKVRKGDGCWEWTGYIAPTGYGLVGPGGSGAPMTTAHRAAWIVHFGSIPEGFIVCHACDNRRCVRPDHLFLWTGSASRGEMAELVRSTRVGYRRGHANRGQDNPRTKLSNGRVLEMREQWLIGVSQTALAARFGVHPSTVSRLVRGQSWRHL